MNEYESVMHIIAESLMDQFNEIGATNFIEQTFEDKENPSRSFVLTMQMKDGLTPCEKLASAQARIKELESKIDDDKYQSLADSEREDH